MKKRIKTLIAAQAKSARAPQLPALLSLSPELETEILQDIQQGRLLTYAQAASKLGCSTEKMRLDAKGFPVIKAGKEHQIPQAVFTLIVRQKLGAA
jgi:hypothetical protein